MLRAEPWVGRTARDRADHAIDLHRTQARRASAASTHYSTPDRPAAGHGADSALTVAESRVNKAPCRSTSKANSQGPCRKRTTLISSVIF
jgi:hypothetical protein